MYAKRSVGVELTAPGSTVQLSRLNWFSAAQAALFATFAVEVAYGTLAAMYVAKAEDASDASVIYAFVWMTYILMPIQGLLILGQIAASAYFHALMRVNRPDPGGSGMTPVKAGTPMMSALSQSVWFSTFSYAMLLVLHVVYTLRNSGDVATTTASADSNYASSVFLLCLWATFGFVTLVRALAVHWKSIVTVTAWKSKH